METERTEKGLSLLIGVFGSIFLVERFFSYRQLWDIRFLPTGLIGGLLIFAIWSILSYYIHPKLFNEKGKFDKREALYYFSVFLLFVVSSAIAILFQFLPIIYINVSFEYDDPSFLSDIGIVLPPPWRQIGEVFKDQLWCSLFALFIWHIKKSVKNQRGFTYKKILEVTSISVIIGAILVVFMVSTAARYFSKTHLVSHISFQASFLMLVLSVLFIILRNNEVKKISSMESIASLRISDFIGSTRFGNSEYSIPKDHLAALGRILYDIFKNRNINAKKIADMAGGTGSLADLLIDMDLIKSIEKIFILDINKSAIDQASKKYENDNKIVTVKCNIVNESEVINAITEKIDFIIINQAIQFLNPHKEEHKKFFKIANSLLPENGYLLIVDEFPQQAPFPEDADNDDYSIEMIMRANVLMPMFAISPKDLINWAVECGFILDIEYDTVLNFNIDNEPHKGLKKYHTQNQNTKRYHPSITGYLLRKVRSIDIKVENKIIKIK